MEAPLEEPIASQYTAAAATWNQLFREFLYAEELAAAAAGDGGAAPSGACLGRLGLQGEPGCHQLVLGLRGRLPGASSGGSSCRLAGCLLGCAAPTACRHASQARVWVSSCRHDDRGGRAAARRRPPQHDVAQLLGGTPGLLPPHDHGSQGVWRGQERRRQLLPAALLLCLPAFVSTHSLHVVLLPLNGTATATAPPAGARCGAHGAGSGGQRQVRRHRAAVNRRGAHRGCGGGQGRGARRFRVG